MATGENRVVSRWREREREKGELRINGVRDRALEEKRNGVVGNGH